MKVELLYSAGCPHHGAALRTLTEVLRECGFEESVTEIDVRDSHQATSLAFPGSPTIRINDRDVEAELPPLQSYGLSCRTYLVNGKRQGVPPRDWIFQAVAAQLEKKIP